MNKLWARAVAIRVPVYLLIAYVTTGGYFFFNQEKLLFPAAGSHDSSGPGPGVFPFENLQIPVTASDHLHAWWIPASKPSGKAIIVFHGNGYRLEDMGGGEAQSLHSIGVNLLLTDYRGYGSSTRVIPSELTVEEDAEAALRYLLHERSVPVHNVFVVGRSIGSGPATTLATENRSLGGLILESPFTSIDDAAAAVWYLRIFPVSLMLHTHFNNLSKIGSVRAPVLVISGTLDTLTPSWMAKAIYTRAHQPKHLYLVPGAGHNDLLDMGGPALMNVLRGFVGN